MVADASIDPLALVIGECITICSEMRKVPKWSQNGVAAILGGQLYSGRDFLFGSDSDETSKFGIKNTLSNNSTHHNNTRFKGESPLLIGFIQLRIMLSDIKNIQEVDTLTLLQPFLMLIKSSSTSGYITSLALSSLAKFLQYSVISPESKNISQSLPQIISSLTHCRFEAGDQASDDAVLLKVLRLLEDTLNADLGDLLSDDVVYEVIQTCLSLACNKRRSEVLRRAAEMAMISITIRIFSKLKDIEPEVVAEDLHLGSDHHVLQEDIIGGTEGKTSFDLTSPAQDNGELPVDSDTVGLQTDPESQSPEIVLATEKIPESTSIEPETVKLQETDEPPAVSNKPAQPFGAPCIKEYLNLLIYMISPSNQYQHMESTRVFAFSLVNTAIEVSANYLSLHPSIMSLVADSICKNLLQTLQTVDQPSLLYASLQLFITLAVTLEEELKLQIELILLTIFRSLAPDFEKLSEELIKNNEKFLKFDDLEHLKESKVKIDSVQLSRNGNGSGAPIRSSVSKEMLLETTSILWTRSPQFFVNLFVNYDCDFERQDTAVSTIKYLCRLSLPDSALTSTDNVPPIALEGLLSFINGIYDRVKIMNEQNKEFVSDSENLLINQKSKKQEFLECMKLLNQDEKKGLLLLKEKGFIKDLEDLDELSRFYFEKSASLNKKKLGELLAKPKNIELLKKFLSLFNFANLRVDEALRLLLKSFRIPGESQQIERIVEQFAEQYVSCQDEAEESEDEVRPDKDAVFVLSYSILMLNTDSHNPQVKEHMTLEQYQKNLKGTYKNKDYPSWYLERIYASITEREIIIPDEHHGTAKWFDDMWNNLISQHDTYQISKQNELHHYEVEEYVQFDKIMFSKTYDIVISTLLTIFEEASDDLIITRMMTAIDKCSNIAIFFKLDDVIDKLVEVLSHLTTLTGLKASQLVVEDGSIRDVIPVTQITVEESKEVITVSEVSVWFGRDFKAQLSTIELFRILKKNNLRITDSWINIITIILTLFENCLIVPDTFPEFQVKLNLPPISKVKPQFQINRNKALKEGGFLSSFSAFLKGYSDEPPEPTDEEIQSTLSTINCITSSNLLSLFKGISNTSPENSDRFVRLLLELLPVKSKSTLRFYDSEVLFILEIAVCLSLVSMNNDAISYIITIIDELFESNKQAEQILSGPSTPEPTIDEKISEKQETQQQKQSLAPPQQQQKKLTIRVSTLVRLSTYKLLLLRNLKEPSESALIQTIERLQSIDRAALLKHGTPLLKPLESLLDEDTWTKDIVCDREQFWGLIRCFASSLKHNEEIFKFIESRIKSCINQSNHFLILGLLDEISSVGAVGAQWEKEYQKLLKTGHQVADKNPYEGVIQTSIKSIRLTAGIKEVVDYKILIQALCHQCYNPCNEIRTVAIQSLEQVLLSSVNKGDDISADSVSENCLFSLLADIMKPENIMDINILKTITKYYLSVGLSGIKAGNLFKYVKIVQLMIRKSQSKDFEQQGIEMLKNMYLILKEENKENLDTLATLDQLKELTGFTEETEESASK